DRERGEAGPELLDLCPLLLQALGSEAARVDGGRRMVRDTDVGVAQRDETLERLRERGTSVRVRRVDVEEAAEIRRLDEAREAPGGSELHLAAPLAQLGGYEREREARVDLRLGGRGEREIAGACPRAQRID